MQELKENKQQYSVHCEDIEKHISNISKNDGSVDSYATEIECYAASKILKTDILVYRYKTEKSAEWCKYSVEELAEQHKDTRQKVDTNKKVDKKQKVKKRKDKGAVTLHYKGNHFNLVRIEKIKSNSLPQINETKIQRTQDRCPAAKLRNPQDNRYEPETEKDEDDGAGNQQRSPESQGQQPQLEWNGKSGTSLIDVVEKAYQKIIHFKQNNLFHPPMGKSLCTMIDEMVKLFTAYNDDKPAQRIALKMIMIMPSLLQQKEFWKSKTKDDNKAFNRRIAAWMRGEYEALLSEAIAIQERIVRKNGRNEIRDKSRAFRGKMEKGLVKQASRVLEKKDKGVLPITEETIEKLKEKHPEPTDINESALIDGEIKQAHPVIFNEITSEMVKKAAVETKGAAGPSGMDAEMWRKILTMRRYPNMTQDLREAIARFARKLCIEKCPHKEAYTNSRLIPLKNSDDVRPIGIGEVLRRIIGQCVLKISVRDVQKAVGNLQVCAGQPAGAEAAVHAIREIHEDSECEGVLLVDAKNAFNTMKRKEMIHNISIICPTISTYVKNTYEESSKLILPQGVELLSSEGTTQGDPMAMAIYALGLSALREKIKYEDTNIKEVTYADDKVGAGKLKDLRKWWDLINIHGPLIGYHPNPSKSCLIVKADLVEEAKEKFKEIDINITSRGGKHLGAVIGDPEFKEAFSRNKIDEWIHEVKELSKIAKTEPHSAFTNFIFSLKQKWTYAMRTIPGIEAYLQPLENSIRYHFLPALLTCQVDDRLRELLALPARLGGMGIMNPAKMANEEYNNSLRLTASLKKLIINQDDTSEISYEEIKEIKKLISRERNNKQRQEMEDWINNNCTTEVQKRRIEMNQEKGASNWLSALPIKENGFSLNKQEFRDAIFLRYGITIRNLPQYCACHAEFSSDHAMICKKGGFVSLRHNEVRDITGEMLNEVCKDVTLEPELIPLTGEKLKYKTSNTDERARTDLSARNFWIRGERAFFDIRVFDPVAPSYEERSLSALHRMQEQDKNRRYAERIVNVEHGSFTPLVFTIAGGMGKQALKFYDRLASMIAENRGQSKSVITSYIRCRLSFSLLRSAILCLRGTRQQQRTSYTHLEDIDIATAAQIGKLPNCN